MEKNKLFCMLVLVLWNILNFLDALSTFWVLKFEKVYDVNQVVNWLNSFGHGYIFVYFILIAILVNFLVAYSFKSKVKDYFVGGLIFYSFIILLAIFGNMVLLYEWVI